MTFTSENLLRELAPQVLGAIVRRFRDFAAAEDAVQEALLAAAVQWPEQGVPENPRGWLIHVASRRMTDAIRADLARRRRETEVVAEAMEGEPTVPSPDSDGVEVHDDSLLLLFMCCHPSLTRPSAIALTLRAVGGLTTAEIARAFLVPEATMAQRISRAKKQIKLVGGRASAMPTDDERAGAARRRAPRAVSDLQRGLRHQRRDHLAAPRPGQRGNPPGAHAAPHAPGRRGSGGPAGADAADRCAPRRAGGCGRRADSARSAGPDVVGPPVDCRGHGAGDARAVTRRRGALSAPGGDCRAAR